MNTHKTHLTTHQKAICLQQRLRYRIDRPNPRSLAPDPTDPTGLTRPAIA